MDLNNLPKKSLLSLLSQFATDGEEARQLALMAQSGDEEAHTHARARTRAPSTLAIKKKIQQ